MVWGLPGGSVVNHPPASAGDAYLILGSRRFPGEGNGNSLQYSCLGNPMDRGAWRATVHGVQSHTRLSNWTTETCVIYFTIKRIKSSCQKWWLWAKPVCGTCQIHFTPCLPTWPSPRGPPNCKLQIYRPTKPRWFPVIAARGTVMNTCLPARFRMRFGRIFTAGSKTLLQSSSLSQELGSIAMEPHHLLL